MIAYFIYFIVFVILLFVLSLATKAISRGIEAKNKISKEKKSYKNEDIIEKINKLKKLLDQGVISKEEFKKAKEKILDL